MVVNMASLPSTVTVVAGAACILGGGTGAWLCAAIAEKSDTHRIKPVIESAFLIRLVAKFAPFSSDLPGNAALKLCFNLQARYFRVKNSAHFTPPATLAFRHRICLK